MSRGKLDLPFAGAVAVAGLLAAAGVCLAHDDPDGRVAELSTQIEREPRSASLRLQRAELHRLRNDWQRGLADLQSARELDPAMPAVDLALARLLLDADNASAARDAANRFVASSPSHVTGRVVLARVLVRQGLDEEAAAEITRAIELDREQRGGTSGIQPDDYLLRARALVRSGRLDEALAGLDEGIAALGSPVSLQIHAVAVEEEAGRFDGALARVARLEATAKRKEAWMSRRGDLLHRSGRADDARAAWRQALGTIESLPPSFRRSPATAALQAELRRKLGEPAPGDRDHTGRASDQPARRIP